MGRSGKTSDVKSVENTAPEGEAVFREEDLVAKPTCDEEHIQNLALIAMHGERDLEKVYRMRYPVISHQEFLRLTNLPEYWQQLNAEVRARMGTRYQEMLLSFMDHAALRQSQKSAEFVMRFLLPHLAQAEESSNRSPELGSLVDSIQRSMTRVLEDDHRKANKISLSRLTREQVEDDVPTYIAKEGTPDEPAAPPLSSAAGA